MKILKKKRGVTLIELLIVISVAALLVILSSLMLPTLLKKARDARRKADLEIIFVALNNYYSDKNCFPGTLPDCGQDFGPNDSPYLKDFPCGPKGESYAYQVDEEDCHQWFKVLTKLEYLADSGIGKVGCQNGCGPGCQYNYGLSSTNIRLNQGCITYYACAPGGECQPFEDPARSECPRFFENDPTCGGANNCEQRESRCHDASGKNVPYIDEPTPTEKPKVTKAPK